MLRRCNNSHLFSSKCVVVFPDEVIEEILSFLPVKYLLRLRCVCKSWKILISDPIFIKLHLKRSARNPHITLVFGGMILPFPVHRLLNTVTIPHANYPSSPLQTMSQNATIWFVGSCNGLICFNDTVRVNDTSREKTFYSWNPATKTLSNPCNFAFNPSYTGPWNFAFGYDNSAHTYKIVAFYLVTNEVKVFNFSYNVWRNIEPFEVIPFRNISLYYNNSVYVGNAINWLAVLDFELQFDVITVDQFVIKSLDLSTETYRQLSPPPGFAKVTSMELEPSIVILMDSLCFSQNFNGTHFIIWQMKEFGVQESWSQFFKISYQILPTIDYRTLFPVWLSKNGDTLILAWNHDDNGNNKGILYNLRDNIAVEIGITDNIEWFDAKDYVESLVSTC